LIFFINPSFSQNLEEETGFKYVKGNYLFDSGRYDEAIQIYNDIIKGEPDFKEVLVYRGRAKFALGAYKGAKKDGLAYIQLNGLNEDVCLMMGKAELGLGNPLVAISYLDYSIFKNKGNPDALLERGNAYFEIEDDVSACTDWHKAIRLGSDRAEQKANTYCQRVAIPIEDEPMNTEIPQQDNGDDILDDNEILSTGEAIKEEIPGGTVDDEVSMEDVIMIDENGAVIKEDVQTNAEETRVEEIHEEPRDLRYEIIEVDEDLDLKFYDGIGSRTIRNLPDILILSENSGQVVVDVCLDRSGNVINASLNRGESTLGSAGLISLALRKSREFKFDRSRKNEQCGKIAFLIK
jgi:tetratricopeptide (TPR) repeat protein